MLTIKMLNMKRREELIGCIYKFTNKINGKCYIGKTANLNRRLWEHKHETCKKSTAFGKALLKYGYCGFNFNILIKIRRITDIKKLNRILDNLEKYYIEKYNSYHFGYNLTKGGDGSLEFHHSEETRRKMSITRKNMPEERKERLRQQIRELGKPYRLKKGDIIPKHHVEVEQYDLAGNYIKTFSSIREAANVLGVTESSNIVSNCRNRRKTAFGYIWKYKN